MLLVDLLLTVLTMKNLKYAKAYLNRDNCIINLVR